MTQHHTHRPEFTNHDMSPVGTEPATEPIPVYTDNKTSTNKLKIGGAIAALSGVLAGTILYLSSDKDAGKHENVPGPSQPVPTFVEGGYTHLNEAPGPTLEEMNADAFKSLPDSERFAYVYKHHNMDKERQQALQEMLPWLTPEQKEVMDLGVPTGDPANWTPEEILRNHYIETWAASSVDDENTPTMSAAERAGIIEEHLKMYSAIVSPDHPEYTEMAGKIGFDKGQILSVSTVTLAYDRAAFSKGNLPFSDGSGRMHDLNGKTTVVMYVERLRNRSDIKDSNDDMSGIAMFQLVKDNQGNAIGWMAVDRYTDAQASIVNAVAQSNGS